MKLKVISLSTFVIIIFSCNNSTTIKSDSIEFDQTELKEIEILEIDPREFVENCLVLSDISDDITYIPLDSKYSLGLIKSLSITSNSIYIQTNENNPVLIRYNRQGNNPIQIGKLGRGPDEYLWCAYFAVNEENDRIYVHGEVNTILIFDTKGNFLKKFKLPIEDNSRGFANMEIINQNYLFIAQNSIGAKAEYNWIITDSIGNIVSSKKNSTPPYKTRIGSGGGIFKYKDVISYWVDYNDTVFAISSDFSYRESIFLTPGDHRMPKKDLKVNNPMKFIEKIGQFYLPALFLETKYYLIHRFTYKGEHGFVFIDKQSQKTYVNHFKSKKFYSGGITNDIDGGMMFRPKSYFDKTKHEYLVMVIDPFELKAHVASDTFNNSTPKYPKKKKALEKLANSLSENDNPVLMLVKLKE